jgi:hypothetical protein
MDRDRGNLFPPRLSPETPPKLKRDPKKSELRREGQES